MSSIQSGLNEDRDDELETLRRHLSEHQAKLRQAAQLGVALADKNSGLESEIERLRARDGEAQQEIDELKANQKTLNRRLKLFQAESDENNAQLSALKEEIESLRSRTRESMDSLKSERSQTKQQAADLDALRKQMEASEERNARLVQMQTSLKEQVNQSQATCEEQQQQISHLTEKVRQLQASSAEAAAATTAPAANPKGQVRNTKARDSESFAQLIDNLKHENKQLATSVRELSLMNERLMQQSQDDNYKLRAAQQRLEQSQAAAAAAAATSEAESKAQTGDAQELERHRRSVSTSLAAELVQTASKAEQAQRASELRMQEEAAARQAAEDANREFFSLSVLAVKVNSGKMHEEAMFMINQQDLWRRAQAEKVPFHKYHRWLIRVTEQAYENGGIVQPAATAK